MTHQNTWFNCFFAIKRIYIVLRKRFIHLDVLSRMKRRNTTEILLVPAVYLFVVYLRLFFFSLNILTDVLLMVFMSIKRSLASANWVLTGGKNLTSVQFLTSCVWWGENAKTTSTPVFIFNFIFFFLFFTLGCMNCKYHVKILWNLFKYFKVLKKWKKSTCSCVVIAHHVHVNVRCLGVSDASAELRHRIAPKVS